MIGYSAPGKYYTPYRWVDASDFHVWDDSAGYAFAERKFAVGTRTRYFTNPFFYWRTWWKTRRIALVVRSDADWFITATVDGRRDNAYYVHDVLPCRRLGVIVTDNGDGDVIMKKYYYYLWFLSYVYRRQGWYLIYLRLS